MKHTTNFQFLQQVNPDTVGWLYQEDTDLSIPLLQAVNNRYYIERDLHKHFSKTGGSAFMDADADRTFGDRLTFLYGSCKKEGSPFFSFFLYTDVEYLQVHDTLEIITPDANYLLHIFAVIEAENMENQWTVASVSSSEEMALYLTGLRNEASLFLEKNAPASSEDHLVGLVAFSNRNGSGKSCILFAWVQQLEYASNAEIIHLEKLALDQQSTVTQYVDVPGRGPMLYYAQKDPLWANMLYEIKGSTKTRKIGGSACAPTSMAMVLANLLQADELMQIADYASWPTGIAFCE